MLRHAICDQDGKVVNVVVWDGVSPWHPHDPTHYVVEHPECDIFDLHCSEVEKGQEMHWFKKYHFMPVAEKQDPIEAESKPTVLTQRKPLSLEKRQITRTNGHGQLLKIYR